MMYGFIVGLFVLGAFSALAFIVVKITTESVSFDDRESDQ